MKKKISDLRLALMHYLLGGFVLSWSLLLAGAIIISSLPPSHLSHSWLSFIDGLLSPSVITLISVPISAWILRKRYIPENSTRIAQYATGINAVLLLLIILLFQKWAIFDHVPLEHNPVQIISSVLGDLAGLTIFYVLTKKKFS